MTATRISNYTLIELLFVIFGLSIVLAILAIVGFAITCIIHYWPQIQALW